MSSFERLVKGGPTTQREGDLEGDEAKRRSLVRQSLVLAVPDMVQWHILSSPPINLKAFSIRRRLEA